MVSQTDPEPKDGAAPAEAEYYEVKCYGHFLDIGSKGECAYCGGRPGTAAFRRIPKVKPA